jgi:di/tripeptidase
LRHPVRAIREPFGTASLEGNCVGTGGTKVEAEGSLTSKKYVSQRPHRLYRKRNEEFGTSGCEGTVAKPTVPKGKLCVYTAVEEVGSVSIFMELRAPDNTTDAYGTTDAVLVGGFYEPGAKAAHIESWGSWAVTAP